MKKIIIISLFSALILFTAVTFTVSAINAYNEDISNGSDMLEGFGAFACILIGGFAVLYEFDLFYTVYYFFIKQKTVLKSVLNILANLSLISVFVLFYLTENPALALILILAYIILRIFYIIVCASRKSKKQSLQN